jgi:hypothetical protein
LLVPEEYHTEYVDPSRTVWSELVVLVLRTMNRATVVAAVGVERRTGPWSSSFTNVRRYLGHPLHPHRHLHRDWPLSSEGVEPIVPPDTPAL